MKNKFVKFMAFLFLIACMCFVLTACNEEEDPTRAVISKALDKAGYLEWRRIGEEGNEEKIVSTFSIDEANRETTDTYSCLVSVTTPYTYISEKLQYHMGFKLENGKWNCTEILPIVTSSTGTNLRLTRKISNTAVKNALTGIGYSLPDGLFIEYRDIFKIVIQEHNTDELGFSDRVKIKYSANYDKKKYEFTGEVYFVYDFNTTTKQGSWRFVSIEIDSVTNSEMSDLYKFDPTKGELYWIFKDCNLDIGVEGNYYTMSKGKISNFEYQEVAQDGSDFLKVPCSFTYELEDFSMDIEADTYFYFNNVEWRIDRFENVKIKRCHSEIVGTWSGVDKQGVEYIINILEDMDSMNRNMVEVTVKTANDTFSYKAFVQNYKIREKDSYLRVDFKEWVKLPMDGNLYGYVDFKGNMKGGYWEIQHGNKWMCTKQE